MRLDSVMLPALCWSSDHWKPAGAILPFSAVFPVRKGPLSYRTWAPLGAQRTDNARNAPATVDSLVMMGPLFGGGAAVGSRLSVKAESRKPKSERLRRGQELRHGREPA